MINLLKQMKLTTCYNEKILVVRTKSVDDSDRSNIKVFLLVEEPLSGEKEELSVEFFGRREQTKTKNPVEAHILKKFTVSVMEAHKGIPEQAKVKIRELIEEIYPTTKE